MFCSHHRESECRFCQPAWATSGETVGTAHASVSQLMAVLGGSWLCWAAGALGTWAVGEWAAWTMGGDVTEKTDKEIDVFEIRYSRRESLKSTFFNFAYRFVLSCLPFIFYKKNKSTI